MTRKQFESLAIDIQKQKFQAVSDNPIQFGMERARFRQQQLAKLIEAGRKVRGSKTVSAKVARYERGLDKVKIVPERFQQLMEEAGQSAEAVHSMKQQPRKQTGLHPHESRLALG